MSLDELPCNLSRAQGATSLNPLTEQEQLLLKDSDLNLALDESLKLFHIPNSVALCSHYQQNEDIVLLKSSLVEFHNILKQRLQQILKMVIVVTEIRLYTQLKPRSRCILHTDILLALELLNFQVDEENRCKMNELRETVKRILVKASNDWIEDSSASEEDAPIKID